VCVCSLCVCVCVCVCSCGKTSMCQLVSVLKNLQFFSINCHLHTEAADFLGGLRPLRQHLPRDQEAKVREKRVS